MTISARTRNDTSSATPLKNSPLLGGKFKDKLRRMIDTGTGRMSAAEFDELDGILDDLRSRHDETPQWEFCEGMMAALICCRRVIAPSEYLPVLLDIGSPLGAGVADAAGAAGGAGETEEIGEGSFADGVQAETFMRLWTQRWNEVAHALDADVERLDDDRAYYPEVMDVCGALATLPPEDRADVPGEYLPCFGQIWALGFMFAVESWPAEWAAPRDKDAGKLLDEALQAIVALTEDDSDPPTLCVFEGGGPPSVSVRRLEAFADAVWAVYGLRELWRNVGPRVETVRRKIKPARNDSCFCGSGKKFKKCHGS